MHRTCHLLFVLLVISIPDTDWVKVFWLAYTKINKYTNTYNNPAIRYWLNNASPSCTNGFMKLSIFFFFRCPFSISEHSWKLFKGFVYEKLLLLTIAFILIKSTGLVTIFSESLKVFNTPQKKPLLILTIHYNHGTKKEGIKRADLTGFFNLSGDLIQREFLTYQSYLFLIWYVVLKLEITMCHV